MEPLEVSRDARSVPQRRSRINSGTLVVGFVLVLGVTMVFVRPHAVTVRVRSAAQSLRHAANTMAASKEDAELDKDWDSKTPAEKAAIAQGRIEKSPNSELLTTPWEAPASPKEAKGMLPSQVTYVSLPTSPGMVMAAPAPSASAMSPVMAAPAPAASATSTLKLTKDLAKSTGLLTCSFRTPIRENRVQGLTSSVPECSIAGYRDGKCHECDCCPSCWSRVELHSKQYRCAERNGIKTTNHRVSLGKLSVGSAVQVKELASNASGFMQGPTLQRLPPGVDFFDNGAMKGTIQYDPLMPTSYVVEFVAISTAEWTDASVGVRNLEISFTVNGNVPREAADHELLKQTEHAHELSLAVAKKDASDAFAAWEQWEEEPQTTESMKATITRMTRCLRGLRSILELYPRMDGGWWWATLGQLEMNLHNLMENVLFDSELYLGYALTFPDKAIRDDAELHLDGCFKKRELEAAKFLWIDGLMQMLGGEWTDAGATLQFAASKQDGWGWGVNDGQIWTAEAAARLVEAAQRYSKDRDSVPQTQLLNQVEGLLAKSEARAPTHPWTRTVKASLADYRRLLKKDKSQGEEAANWELDFIHQTHGWCTELMKRFQRKARPEAADDVVRRLPGSLTLSA